MRKTPIAITLLSFILMFSGCSLKDSTLVTGQPESSIEASENTSTSTLDCHEEFIQYTAKVEGNSTSEEYASAVLEEALQDAGIEEKVEYQYDGVSETPNLSVYTFQQYYEGIPVYGYTLSVSAGNNGSSWSVSGTVLILDGETNCNISEEEAEEYAKGHLWDERGLAEENYTLGSLGLYIDCDDGSTACTTYLFEQYGNDSSETALRTLFVNAETGEVMHDYDTVLY